MAMQTHGSQSDDDNGRPPGTPRSRRGDDGAASAITDPLLAWAVRTNFRYLGGPPEWLPLLVHTPGKTASEVAEGLSAEFLDEQPLWIIPGLFLNPPPGLEKLDHFCILLNWRTEELQQSARKILASLEKLHGRYELGLPIGPGTQSANPESMVIPPNMPPPPTPLPISWPAASLLGGTRGQAKVVVGVIDDAFAPAHERLRKAGTMHTRVDSIWVQEIGTAGMVITDGDIDAHVAACTHAGLVDESQVYRNLRLENFTDDSHKSISRGFAHGVHVMDIAAGCDPGKGPSDCPIVGVQLPGRVVRDTSGAMLTPYALWGLVYILLRSLAYSKGAAGDVPVVVNLSYGLFNGPHDGTSVFELAVDAIVRLWNAAHPQGQLCVVLPAGNNFLWRTHAHFELEPKAKKHLHWRVVPDDRTPSTVEIWLPHEPILGPKPSATVQVTAPDGTTSGPMNLGDPDFEQRSQGAGLPVVWTVRYQTAAATGSRPQIMVNIAPTAAYNPRVPGEAVAASGVWHIDITNTGPAAKFNAWIHRDDTPFGWRVLGRQSYFDDPHYSRFTKTGRDLEEDNAAGYPLSYVRRLGTINGLATGARTVVIAGCRKSDLRMARYSAAGPFVVNPAWTRPFLQRTGPDPDASAVSEDSPARRGILAAGTRSNTVAAMGGTSVAAPQATRWIADQMAKGGYVCRDGVENLAKYLEAHFPKRPRIPWACFRTGMGRIDDQEPPLPRPHPSR
jgi:hypothetical protein